MPEITSADAARKLTELSAQLLAANRDGGLLAFAEEKPKDWPRWYLELLTKLYAATRNAAAIYVTTDLLEEVPEGAHQVIVLTEKLVVRGAVNGLGSNPEAASVEIEIWPRARLSQTSLRQMDVMPIDGASVVQFPTGLRLGLRYVGLDDWITIPLGKAPNKDIQKATAELYDSLEEDLVTPWKASRP